MAASSYDIVANAEAAEECSGDFNAIYRLNCERAGFDQVVQVRQSHWEQDPEKAQRALEWLGDRGGLYDTDEGVDPPVGTVAMWWRDWSAAHGVNWFAFADYRMACEFKLKFG